MSVKTGRMSDFPEFHANDSMLNPERITVRMATDAADDVSGGVSLDDHPKGNAR